MVIVHGAPPPRLSTPSRRPSRNPVQRLASLALQSSELDTHVIPPRSFLFLLVDW